MTDKIISERGSGRVEIARREGGRGRPTPRERPRQAGDEKAWPPGTPPPSPAGAPSTVGSGRQGISGEGHPAASAGSRPARASSGGGRVGHRVNEERRTRQVRGKENATMAPPPRASIKHGRWVTAESDVAFGVHEARGATTSRRKDPPLRSGAAVTPGRRRAARGREPQPGQLPRSRGEGARLGRGPWWGPHRVHSRCRPRQPGPAAPAMAEGRNAYVSEKKRPVSAGGITPGGLLGQRACTAKEDPASVERAAWRGGGGGGEGSCCGREQWRPFVAVCTVSAERAGPRGGAGQPYAGQTALWGQSQAEGLGPGLSAARTTPSAGGPRRAARGGSRVPVGQSAWRQGCPEGGSGNLSRTRRKGG